MKPPTKTARRLNLEEVLDGWLIWLHSDVWYKLHTDSTSKAGLVVGGSESAVKKNKNKQNSRLKRDHKGPGQEQCSVDA